MGVWERSPAGIAIALANPAAASRASGAPCPTSRRTTSSARPTASATTSVDAHLGGPDGLAAARAALAERGLGLILDFVPNHVAPDHPWTRGTSGVLRPRRRGRPRARPGFVRPRRRARRRERPRPVLPRLARRRAARRVLARPARRRRRDAPIDRAPVRRRALRHGDARDERRLRADVGRRARRRGPEPTTGRR